LVVVDAHLHLWSPQERPYAWLEGADPAIARRFGPEDALPLLAAAGVDRAVLVQAADHRGDTDAMLAVADAHPEVAGVVGWVPLEDPARTEADLAELRRHPAFVGVRNLTHDQPDPDHLLRADIDASLGVLEAAGVPLDVVAVLPRHLEHVPVLSERHPDLRIVVDHLATPPVGADDGGRWAELLARAAEYPLVHSKVSGLYPVAGDPMAWSAQDLRPAFEHALEVFGPDRLMYGSDWPVSVLHGGYARVWEQLSLLFDALAPAEREAVLGGTAAAFYRLPAPSAP
jgi:L-fuconolactonase